MAEQKKIIMPSASFIVARSYPDGVIGCENQLPWKLSSDLQRFRRLTEQHVVIMGRKTLESIGRPLPNRINIVVSRSEPISVNGVEWVSSLEDAVFLADFYSICRGKDNFFVIGGDQIYSSFLNRDMYNKIYLTEVFCGEIKGDAFFKYEFDLRKWKIEEEVDHRKSDKDEFPFRFITYARKSGTVRYRTRSELLTEHTFTERWKQVAKSAVESWERTHQVETSEAARVEHAANQHQFRLAV
jgi:dihydrofolate reductase